MTHSIKGETKMESAGEILADILIEAGIDHVFGMPGGATPYLFDALIDRQDKIRTVLAYHEGGAACMADVYGRITGQPALLMGQGIWIGTSGAFGIAESYLAGVPMIIICDVSDYAYLPQYGPYQNSTGDYGAIDLPNIMRSITKYTTLAANPSEFVHGVQLAVKHATTGRPGPACVLFRWEVSKVKIDRNQIHPKLFPTQGYLRTSPPRISTRDAEQIAAILLAATAPMMIIGAGIHRSKAYAEVQQLAERIGLPVASTYGGKSGIAENHACALGMIGKIGQKIANQKIAQADVILTVGTCLAPENTKYQHPDFIRPDSQKIIQIDIEPLNSGWTYPVEMAVVSDAKIALEEIINVLAANSIPFEVQKRINDLQQAKEQADYFRTPDVSSDEAPIAPESVVKALNDIIGPEDLIILDAANNRMFMSHYFQTKKAGQIVAANGAAGIGYGPPAALAAQMIQPDKRVISFVGDGGLLSQLYVLEMAKNYKLPLTFVVMNNAVLGNVKDYEPETDRWNLITRYSQPNFSEIARGCGVHAVRVERTAGLQDALSRALESNQPELVECIVAETSHLSMAS
jgi:acetolactate synthase-1/2/3 large subunit